MKRQHLLILIALLTVGTVAAQNPKKVIFEEGPELEKMKAIFNFLYKNDSALFDSSPSVENEPFPWMNKPERVPSTKDLFYHLDAVQMVPEDSLEDSPDIYITGAYRSGMGVEGMIDIKSYPDMIDCGTGAGKQTHLISNPIASLGNLRIELISHLYDKEKRAIGFSSLSPTYHEKLIREEDGYFQFKTTCHLSLDTLYSAVAGGSMEIRWLAPPRYSHITISAADTNRTDSLRLQNIPFRVEVFKPNHFILSSAACYADSIKKWQYSCLQNGARMRISSTSNRAGDWEELQYIYHHPNLTFEEWLEHAESKATSESETTGNEPWAKWYQTNIDADSICLYTLLPDDDARVLASARLVYGQPKATKKYLNEALFYELRGEGKPDPVVDNLKDADMPVFKAPVPEKDTWNDKQKYNYACGLLCADWVQRTMMYNKISIRYGYAVSNFTALHYLPDWQAGMAWRAARGKEDFLFTDFKGEIDSRLFDDNRKAFFFVAGILFPGVFERPVAEMDSNLILRALFDHLEETTLMSAFDHEAEAVWRKYHDAKRK